MEYVKNKNGLKYTTPILGIIGKVCFMTLSQSRGIYFLTIKKMITFLIYILIWYIIAYWLYKIEWVENLFEIKLLLFLVPLTWVIFIPFFISTYVNSEWYNKKMIERKEKEKIEKQKKDKRDKKIFEILTKNLTNKK